MQLLQQQIAVMMAEIKHHISMAIAATFCSVWIKRLLLLNYFFDSLLSESN